MIATALRALALVAAVTLCALPARAQTVVGTVVDSTSGAAIRGVYVALLDPAGHAVSGTESDSLGKFALRAPAAGTYRLRTTHLGYWNATSAPVRVGADGALSIQLQVVARPITVDGLTVSAAAPVRHLAEGGFYRRQRMGFGHYITRDEIVASAAFTLTDLLRRHPGAQIITVDGEADDNDVILRSGRTMSFRGLCLPSVAIDGNVIRSGGVNAVAGLQTLVPSVLDIEAIEIYNGQGGLPGWASGTVSPCGAILIWTRR